MALTVRSIEQTIGVFKVSPSGSLDSNTSPVLEKKINNLLDSAAKAIVFDLKDLAYITSAGIRVMIITKKAMEKRQGKFAVINPQPQVEKVFEIINAIPVFNIFKSVTELDRYLDEMQRSVPLDGSGADDG